AAARTVSAPSPTPTLGGGALEFNSLPRVVSALFSVGSSVPLGNTAALPEMRALDYAAPAAGTAVAGAHPLTMFPLKSSARKPPSGSHALFFEFASITGQAQRLDGALGLIVS